MKTLSRRTLTLALAAAPFSALAAPPKAAALSAADQALVDKAAAYLQGLGQAQSRFVQTDPAGRNATGTVYLKRPGKARFAYDPPSAMLVVADGNFVSISNPRLKTFERYPLMSTPLSLFLAKRVKIDRSVVVTRVARSANGFALTMRDGKENTGALTLTFADQPMKLLAWTVADAQGRETRVRLLDLAPATGLANGLFVLNDPRPAAPGRGKL